MSEYNYEFVKKLSPDIHKRLSSFIRLCSISDEMDLPFFASCAALFEIGFKYYLVNTNDSYYYQSLSLSKMLSDTFVFKDLISNIKFNVDIVQKCRIFANSNKHDLELIESKIDRRELIRNILLVYCSVYNHFNFDKIKEPTIDDINFFEKKDYLRSIEDNKKILDAQSEELKELNEKIEHSQKVIDDINSRNIIVLLDRANDMINSFKYEGAYYLYKNVVNLDVLNYSAYIGMILAKCHTNSVDGLFNGIKVDIETMDEYKDALSILNESEKSVLINIAEIAHKEYIYNLANDYMDVSNYEGAYALFDEINDYKDSKELSKKCELEINYSKALDFFHYEKYPEAKDEFEKLDGYKDSIEMTEKCNDYIALEEKRLVMKHQSILLRKAEICVKNYLFEEAIDIYKSLKMDDKVDEVIRMREKFELFIAYVRYEMDYDEFSSQVGLDYAGMIVQNNRDRINERIKNIERYYNDLFYKETIDFMKELKRIEKNSNADERKMIFDLIMRYIKIYDDNGIFYKDNELIKQYLERIKNIWRKDNE